jgi:hypothetical protein
MQFFNKPPGKSKDTPAHQDGFYFMITPQSACSKWSHVVESKKKMELGARVLHRLAPSASSQWCASVCPFAPSHVGRA